MTIDQSKAVLRDHLREARQHISQNDRDAAARSVCKRAETLINDHVSDHAADHIPGNKTPEKKVVAGYWPMRDEIDIRPLLIQLHKTGFTCALPVVEKALAPLAFHQWQPADPLEKSSFGLHQPSVKAPKVAPQILIVPLLAFDRDGMRLGWGGGYYDRTLAELRVSSDVLAMGVGFSIQQVDKLPRDRHDQRLDFMVTQDGVIEFS